MLKHLNRTNKLVVHHRVGEVPAFANKDATNLWDRRNRNGQKLTSPQPTEDVTKHLNCLNIRNYTSRVAGCYYFITLGYARRTFPFGHQLESKVAAAPQPACYPAPADIRERLFCSIEVARVSFFKGGSVTFNGSALDCSGFHGGPVPARAYAGFDDTRSAVTSSALMKHLSRDVVWCSDVATKAPGSLNDIGVAGESVAAHTRLSRWNRGRCGSLVVKRWHSAINSLRIRIFKRQHSLTSRRLTTNAATTRRVREPSGTDKRHLHASAPPGPRYVLRVRDNS
ncbi:hypothetical protein EVAR_51942_1 [Eumeta japonica]|uniref:Uncharacterized protein n=1 Tax=Eumeta variegata TaxID=151549 RepID=A0A4C1YJA6_EUMVA|nr:hypothetical protein EVAR_51942_1 [Eumeta japonica]